MGGLVTSPAGRRGPEGEGGGWGTHELRSVEKILAVFDRPRSRSVIGVSDETGQALEFEQLGRIGRVERKMKTEEGRRRGIK